jgi:4-hydroxy-2-oxoheptanedioate aldolase
MRENIVRTIWQMGNAVINGWLTRPSAWTAEVMAHQGWDSLVVDTQHGLIGYETALAMLQAISTTQVIPLARAWWNEPAGIMKLLDAGAMGIICPMVNNRKEAEAFVGACQYAPLGYRSAGPTRAVLYAGDDYLLKANESIITIAMIETVEALQNVDEIMSVPGLDAVYIGPTDLSISLGLKPGGALTQPLLAEAIDKVLAAAIRHHVIGGIHTSSTADALAMIDKGFLFVTVMTDTRMLIGAAQQAVAAVRKIQPASTSSSSVPY